MDLKKVLMQFVRGTLFKMLALIAMIFSFSNIEAKERAEQKKEQGSEKKGKTKSAEKKSGKKKTKKKKEILSKPKETVVTFESKNTAPKQEYTHLPLLETKKTKAEKASKTSKTSVEMPENNSAPTTDQSGRTVFEGSYGSRYVLNKNGKKLYLKQNK